jgi:hypothetical protein
VDYDFSETVSRVSDMLFIGVSTGIDGGMK